MTASESEKESPQDGAGEEQIDDITPPLPPDGGWGWMVVAASLLCNILVDGVCFTFGIFYVEFLDYFGESKAKTAWVGSLVPGMYLAAGPIVSALANKFGCRTITIIGSVVASISFFCSTFSPNVNWLIFTYGICGGLGFGLMYLPSIVIVGYYFDSKRAFATGLAVCGSGIGTFLFAPLARVLLDEYGWKGANWIIAGLILNGIFCGLVFRPLEAKMRKKRPEANPVEIDHGTIFNKIQKEKERQRQESTGSLNNTIITNHNELIKDEEIVRQIMLKYDNQFPKPENRNSGSMTDIHKESNKLNARSTSRDEDPDFVTKSQSSLVDSSNNVSTTTTPTAEKPINWNIEKLRLGAGNKPRLHTMSETSERGLHGSNAMLNSRENLRKRKEEVSRPLYRADIFYSGSVTSIPEYVTNPNMNSYVASVTSIPEVPVNEDSLKAKCMPLCSVLKQMLDFSLLKSVTFVILCTASVLAMTGFFTPFVYITDLALGLGVPINKATFLLSILGIFNTLGRIISGWLSDRSWADCLLIHNLSLVIAGIATCILPFLEVYSLIAIYCAIFGSCIAAFIALRSIVLVELLGIQKLSNSFGILLLFQGIASIIGSPLSGALYDITGSYNVSFMVSGGLIAVAGLICLPVRWIARWEQARDKDFSNIRQMGSQYSTVDRENNVI